MSRILFAMESALTSINQPLRRADLIGLGAIMLLGLVVRLYGLTGYGIWFDEAYHLALVRLPTVGAMLGAVLANPPSDPLYVLLLRGWTGLFGTSDAAARSLSVLLSTATLPAVFWLGRQLVGNAVGFMAALFLALSPYAVEFGQEAALYVLASLATTAALAAGLQWRASGRGMALYVALGIAAIYSHYVVAPILILFAVLAPLFTARKLDLRRWVAAHAVIVLAWAPWLAALGISWASSALPRATLRHPATLDEVIGALVQYSSGTAALLNMPRLFTLTGLAVGVALLVAGLRARRVLLLPVLLFALIFIIPAPVSALTGLWLFVPHFMLFLLPALLVVLAAGALHLLAFADWRTYLGVLLLIAWVVVQYCGLMIFHGFPPHGADGLRELAAELRQNVQPGDAVLVTPPALMPTLAQYYPGPTTGLPADFDLRAIYTPYDPATWKAAVLAALDPAVAGRGRFWLIYNPAGSDEDGALLAEIRARYRQERQLNYQFGDLLLFVSK